MFPMFDYTYFLFIAPGLILSLWASWRVKSNFRKYSAVRSMRGLTGAQAAEELLRQGGVRDVRIERSHGMLSDHYNPVTRTLALSDGVYGSTSVAAVGIASHEAGHALQHAQNYGPLRLRSALVPTASIGSNIGYFVMFLGLFIDPDPGAHRCGPLFGGAALPDRHPSGGVRRLQPRQGAGARARPDLSG